MINRKTALHAVAACATAVILGAGLAMSVPAGQAQAITVSGAKNVSSTGNWTAHGGNMYYKLGTHTARTLCNIGGNAYLFTMKGAQKTGWRKYKGSYYYFKVANGSKGAMVANKVVNGVKLGSNGKAKLSNAAVKAELKVFVKSQKTLDKLTNSTDTVKTKLRKCFNYIKGPKIRECVLHEWTKSTPHTRWWIMFAKDVLYKKQGDCNSQGCAMAYLANACGCKKVEACASGGHGWARVNGRYYDPEWTRYDKNHYVYFDVPGKYGNMNYKDNCRYVCNLTRTKIWK